VSVHAVGTSIGPAATTCSNYINSSLQHLSTGYAVCDLKLTRLPLKNSPKSFAGVHALSRATNVPRIEPGMLRPAIDY
jgi:hypothetical protein